MWTIKDMPDQTGKTVIITGANSGIGYEMALAFYQAGAEVIVASRDSAKAEKAIYEIRNSGGNGLAKFMALDLSSLSGVQRFAAAFIADYHKLDILINNAGVMTPPQSKTAEGFELQFGVNFLAHYTLTGLLYPLLKRSHDARVVTLSSGAYKNAGAIDYENLRIEKFYDPIKAYAISKLADLQFAIEFQKRLDLTADPVISLAAHPGVTQSSLSRFMSQDQIDAAVTKFGELMPAWQGALPALFAATARDAIKGGYYGPDGENELKGYPAPAFISEEAANASSARVLWGFAQDSTGVTFPL
jgi:NAD(P)-dependent dehydrogenase (short-subunit alcohol dehydrogenase family)